MKKIKLIFCLQFLFCTVLNSQNKISNKSGNWSDPSAWTPAGVPSSTNNVIISNGNTISIDINANCNSLSIGTGGSTAILRFTGNTALTLNVVSNLTVNSNGSIRLRSNSNSTHTITLKGDITNNGSIDLNRDSNSLCDLVFTNNGHQSFNGIGSTNDLNNIVLNMGSSSNNILEVSTSNFTVPQNFLKLMNGTFQFSSLITTNIIPFTNATTLASSTGLWVDSPNASVTTNAGVSLSGKITVSNGTLNIGNASNEDLTSTGGSLIVSGGQLNVAGRYDASANFNSFNISGGTVIVPAIGSSNTSVAPFQITGFISQFTMSGGSIIIPREGGSGLQDLGFVATGFLLTSISDGTLQIGNSSTPTGQTIGIKTSYAIPNLLVNSSNATAIINTHALTVNNHIRINSGTLNANNLGLNLGGNWSNSGMFTPGTGTVTFNSSGNQSIFKSGGEIFNAISFAGGGTKSLLSPVIANSNFSLITGTSFDVSNSNYQLTVKGNFINDGNFIARKGLVLFNGLTQQTIGGNSVTNFYNLTVNNTSDVVLAGSENLLGTLTLNNGTFNTNSYAFSLISNSNGTARIAEITGSGNITGNITVQRYAPGGTTGWALLGTPITSALSFNDWDDNIAISCATCPDGTAGGFLSIYSYDETAPGIYDAPASYIPLSTINDPITPGKGYWVYLGNGQYTTTPIVLDVTGSVRKFNYTLPLNYTNSGSPANDGWNLISNPYPSAISWAALKGSASNIDNAIYVYNADLNSGTGGFASYVNGVSSPAVAAGGINDHIPMGQGFYVHSTGATSLNAKESNKISTDPTFLKSNNSNQNPLLRISLCGVNTFTDECVLYFETNATDTFDLGYDAYKMRGQDPYAPSIALESGNQNFQINGVAPISGNFTMALKVLTGYSGTYTISSSDFSLFPNGACFSLYDKVTNISTDLRSSSHIFNLSDTTNASRFILSITLNSLTINQSINLPSCQEPNSGSIVVSGTNSGPWNYFWKTNGNIIRTSINKSGADTLNNLSSGNFEVEINTTGLCDNTLKTFNITPKITPVAQFSCVDTLFLAKSDSIHFTNTSTNSILNTWLFGNESWFVTEHSPTHRYNSPGTYTVSLMCKSSTGCISTTAKKIEVIGTQTNLNEIDPFVNDLVLKTLGNNEFIIEQKFKESITTQIKVFNLLGELIYDLGKDYSNALTKKIDLKNKPSGIYFVKITYPTKQKTVKITAE